MNSPVSKLVRTLQALVDNGVEPCDINIVKEEPAAEEVKAEAAQEQAPAAE